MSVIRRLPRYYRFLGELEKNGESRISSKELSKRMGLTASQIRQDFNCFGGFGQQGYGYNVTQLREEMKKILGISRQNKCVLIGAGNLGKAIAGHIPFSLLGFQLIGIFDSSPQVIGGKIKGIEIQSGSLFPEFYKKHHPVMSILCTNTDSAEAISDQLYQEGIRCFWNFTHYDISLKHPDVIVENVHMNDSMMTLCYKLEAAEKSGELQ